MKKLIFVSLLIISTVRLSAQQADFAVQGIMAPAIVDPNVPGLLTVDVFNAGFTTLSTGCVIVSISVPSAISEILSVNPATNSIWTVYSTVAMPSAIVLRNTGGPIPDDFEFYSIMLNIKGTNQGGPLTINFSVAFVPPFTQGGCAVLGNTQTLNDFGQTSITVQTPAPLGVNLSAFTGTMSDCSALLKWTSKTETDNNRYEVEVSKDGRAFSYVGVVKGVGNSGTDLSYSFTDKKPLDGYSFYRLKMIANSGEVEYSGIVTINNKCNPKAVRIYPNPLVENQQFGVYISGYTGTLKGELMSMSGQLIQTFTLHNGTNTLSIKGVAQGSYMMRVTEASSGANESYKVTVIK